MGDRVEFSPPGAHDLDEETDVYINNTNKDDARKP